MPREVLVIGYGAAGAAAAITAHDAGAHVTILEKTPAGGGNARYSGGFLFDITGPGAIDYLDALCFGRTDRAVLEAYAAGLHELEDWLGSLGGELSPFALPPGVFPRVFPSWPNFPGAGGALYTQFKPADGARPGQSLWNLLERAVESRGIEVRPGVRAAELDLERGRVAGVDGAACDAVILATGGFEGSAALTETYLPLSPIFPVGHTANTGDGIAMALRAGAALWHMPAFFGWLAFRHPDHAAAFPIDFHGRSHLIVDADGRRFHDETGWEAHDRVRALTVYLPRNANAPRLPLYGICDQATLAAGPLNGIVGTPNDYRWSADNAAEVATGWIATADSGAELAARLGLASHTLTDTLAAFNAAAAGGRDPDFARRAEDLAVLHGPLYAIELWPGVATTAGGPRRSARAEVLDAQGVAIPGLYAAGGNGSIWGHLTQHGGGLTDALVFGRIAGREVARGA
jgi:succinate dehydrogenase/fumarate reductase flavoprotein subunit